MTRHIKDLQPVVGSKTSSEDESGSEDSARLVYLKLNPLSIASDISTLPADANVASCSDADGSSIDKSSSKDEAPVLLLRRNARQKRPAPSCTVSDHNRGVQDESGNLPPWSKLVHTCVVIPICQACKLCICRHSHQADATFSWTEELCDFRGGYNESVSWLDTPKVSGSRQVWKLWLVAGLCMQMRGVLHRRVTKLYVKSWNERRRHSEGCRLCVTMAVGKRWNFSCFITHFNTLWLVVCWYFVHCFTPCMIWKVHRWTCNVV